MSTYVKTCCPNDTAFPVTDADPFGGLTKREWLAGTIAAGLASRPNTPHCSIATEAVEIADALILALAKPIGE